MNWTPRDELDDQTLVKILIDMHGKNTTEKIKLIWKRGYDTGYHDGVEDAY